MSFKTRHETRTRLVDADGNLLEDEVPANVLNDGEGNVDGKGQVQGQGEEGVPPGVAQPQPDGRIPEGRAPPHPDVEGQNPETADGGEVGKEAKGKGVGENEDVAADQPPTVGVDEDLEKEREVVENGGDEPMPASEGNEAT